MAGVTNKQILQAVTEVKALATTNALAVSSLRTEFQGALADVNEQLGMLSGQVTELDRRMIKQETISNERKDRNPALPIATSNDSKLTNPKIFLIAIGAINSALFVATLALQILQARGG
jgi:hypothetical protein